MTRGFSKLEIEVFPPSHAFICACGTTRARLKTSAVCATTNSLTGGFNSIGRAVQDVAVKTEGDTASGCLPAASTLDAV